MISQRTSGCACKHGVAQLRSLEAWMDSVVGRLEGAGEQSAQE